MQPYGQIERYNMGELITLKEMCRRERVTRRMVQGYEQKKLVFAAATNKYGHLLYNEEAQKRVKRIRLYQQFGFSLDDIKKLFDLPNKELKIRLELQIQVMQEKREAYGQLINEAKDIISKLEEENIGE